MSVVNLANVKQKRGRTSLSKDNVTVTQNKTGDNGYMTNFKFPDAVCKEIGIGRNIQVHLLFDEDKNRVIVRQGNGQYRLAMSNKKARIRQLQTSLLEKHGYVSSRSLGVTKCEYKVRGDEIVVDLPKELVA